MAKIHVILTLLFAIIHISRCQLDCFNLTSDMHGFGGLGSDKTLPECKESCVSNPSCIAIDWDENNKNGTKCWTLVFISEIGIATGVNHYVLDRNKCPVPTLSTGSTVTDFNPLSTPLKTVVPSTYQSNNSFTALTIEPPPAVDSNSSTLTISTTSHPSTSIDTTSTTLATTSTTASNNYPTSVSVAVSTEYSITASTTTTPATVTTATTATLPSSSVGRSSYVIVFPPKPQTTTVFLLSICSPSLDDVTVEVLAHNVEMPFCNTFTVSLAACHIIEVPNNMSLEFSNTMSTKYLTVTSSNYVSVILTMLDGCASYTTIPESLLGTDYYISTLKPYENDSSIVTVTAIADRTAVYVVVESHSKPCSIKLNNGTLLSLELPLNLTISLDRGQTYQLSSNDCDLTGTNIHSSKPVAVLAGNINAFGKNYAVIQFPPVTLWGGSYIAATLPSSADGYQLKVLSTVRNANIVVDGNLVNTTNYLYMSNFSARPVHVTTYQTTDQPILVVQYPLTFSAAIILPSVEVYRPIYNFILPQNTSLQFYVLLSMLSGDDLTVILRKQTQDFWKQLKSTNTSDYYDGYFGGIDSKPSYLLLTNSSSKTFGAYIYAYSDTCSFGYPLVYSKKDTLTKATGSTFKAQAIRSAYIVLAGLGGGCILLVIIAVVIICSYPMTEGIDKRTPNNSRHVKQAAASSETDEQEVNERNHQVEVETNPYYHHSDDETHTSHQYDDNDSAKVEDNPYFNSSDIPLSCADHDSNTYNAKSSYHCSEDATAAL